MIHSSVDRLTHTAVDKEDRLQTSADKKQAYKCMLYEHLECLIFLSR